MTEESFGIWKGKTKDGKDYYSGTLPVIGKFTMYDNGEQEAGSKRPQFSLKLTGSKVQTANFVPEPKAKEDDLPF